MKKRLWEVLSAVVILGLLAVTVTACGSGKNATASTAVASTPAGQTESQASTAVVTTVAGKAGDSGHRDGNGAAARFNQPVGIACDAAGNLYVADTENSIIRKITPAGEVTTLAGKAGSRGHRDGSGATARFSSITDLACDAAGNLYVTDNATIRKITPAGKVTTLAGKAGSWGSADGSGAAARFDSPQAVACDAAGTVYVADGVGEGGNNTIRKITPAGKVTTLAGKAGSKGSADGRGAAARFFFPFAIACDAADNVYVLDGDSIRKITPAGKVTTLARKTDSSVSTDGSGTAVRFFSPEGIACDAVGNLYLIDGYSIREMTLAGEVTTVAGKAGSSGSTDGSGVSARFYSPYGITCDAAGNLYVADYYNCTIRKITLSH